MTILLKSHLELNSHLERLRGKKQIGFVPTMGALHEGHMSLMKQSLVENNITITSIFVNPKQFGPFEDYALYPRLLDEDLTLCQKIGVDYVFAPEISDIYPADFSMEVSEKLISKSLCGAFRPGHFDGVCTVLMRLFGLVQPNKIYLGLKDLQQYLIVKKMVQDFALPYEIIGCEIVREQDGLALSSRNRYLSKEERLIAPLLYQSLLRLKNTFSKISRSSDRSIVIGQINQYLEQEKLELSKKFKVQYYEWLEYPTLNKVNDITKSSLFALAAYLGRTRLIDNILIRP